MTSARIDRVGSQGDGIADSGVFVPLTLPGERVLVRGSGERAELSELLEPSSDRVIPPCNHFGACGGCALQHWSHAPYLAWKREQVRLALARVRIETEIVTAFAAPPGSRRRIALHARKEGSGAVLGFKARRSWRLAPIESCVVARPELVAALPSLRDLAAPFLEHPKSAPILHVTATDTGLDVDVTGIERRSGGLSADARAQAAIAAARGNVARVTLAGDMIFQARAPMVRLGPATVALPPGAFLQAVAEAEAAMARIIVLEVGGARGIADLYCGVGTFTFRLAAAAPVLAADSSVAAVSALRSAIASAPGTKPIAVTARDLERRPILAAELAKMDAVVLDPPRAGAAAQCAELARSRVERIVVVSCNPATFARDARTLAEGGFTLKGVKLVDQFLWSPHIELVGVFSRRPG